MQVLGDLCVVSYWIDTLVLKLREILTLLCCITLSSSRENQGSAQEVARRISRAVVGVVFAQVKTYQVPITNSSPSHLHCLPFASHFPLPHFTLDVLFALSFPISSSLFACLFPFAPVLDHLLCRNGQLGLYPFVSRL